MLRSFYENTTIAIRNLLMQTYSAIYANVT